MKCASIDIGTNTILLLVGEVGHDMREIVDITTTTRLGEGLHENGFLLDVPMARSLEVLKQYCGITASLKVEQIYCIGTSALREAQNSSRFLEMVKKECGLSVEIISGQQEAYYTYQSIKNDGSIRGDRLFIIDIGGGSTEMIIGDRENMLECRSLPVGVVKLTEMFIQHDPPLDQEIGAAKNHIQSFLRDSFDHHECLFVGTGGTITTLANMKMGLKDFDKESIHGVSLSLADVDTMLSEMRKLTNLQRAHIPGMEKGRETIIVQGTLLLREIMFYTGRSHCIVSTWGVRYGVLFEHYARNKYVCLEDPC